MLERLPHRPSRVRCVSGASRAASTAPRHSILPAPAFSGIASCAFPLPLPRLRPILDPEARSAPQRPGTRSPRCEIKRHGVHRSRDRLHGFHGRAEIDLIETDQCGAKKRENEAKGESQDRTQTRPEGDAFRVDQKDQTLARKCEIEPTATEHRRSKHRESQKSA
jgi:hypothetical protein